MTSLFRVAALLAVLCVSGPAVAATQSPKFTKPDRVDLSAMRFFLADRHANMIMGWRGAQFQVVGDWDVPVLTERTRGAGLLQVRAAEKLNTLDASEPIVVPLPATFPLLMGVCLATAFVGRTRRKA